MRPRTNLGEHVMTATIRFAAIGLDHRHILGQVGSMLKAGAECVGFYTDVDDLVPKFTETFPSVPRIAERERILEDDRIDMVVSAAIPSQRAALGVEAMRHGKDYMVDKPGFTTLDQLDEVRRVQSETGRIYSVCFSERFEVPAAAKATELVQAGAIGQVVQTLGLGPHRLNRHLRPDWFFRKADFGGILNDIGSHQVDQFLHYTGSTEGEIVTSAVGNYANPSDPELSDFGQIVLRSPHANGYIRVDWFTPDGLPTWGDGRLFLQGTEGYIELRKYVDIAGRPGKDHLFLVDNKGVRYIDCSDVDLPYARQLIHDVLHRTETAMSQEHCFLASQLALEAEANATELTPAVRKAG